MNAPQAPVAVGVDGSPEADAALAWAAGEAARRGASLLVVSAVGSALPTGVVVDGGTASSQALNFARQLAEARVAHARARGEVPEGMEVAVEAHLSGAGASLLHASGRACLVVVGHRGRGALASALLGSVAYSVTARAECPVVVVRGDAQRTPGPRWPVVVGIDVDTNTDADPAGSPALGMAARTARRSRAPLTVLAAVGPGEPLAGEHGVALAEDMIVRERSIAGSRVDAACAAALRTCPELDVRAEVVQARAADALVAASQAAGLVVVGARGLGRVPGLFLGSVSHEVVHRAACPVVVARDRQG